MLTSGISISKCCQYNDVCTLNVCALLYTHLILTFTSMCCMLSNMLHGHIFAQKEYLSWLKHWPSYIHILWHHKYHWKFNHHWLFMATLAWQPNYWTFLIQDCLLLQGSQNVSTSTQCHYPDIGSTHSPQMIAIQFSQLSLFIMFGFSYSSAVDS